jgi:hypothetical protein
MKFNEMKAHPIFFLMSMLISEVSMLNVMSFAFISRSLFIFLLMMPNSLSFTIVGLSVVHPEVRPLMASLMRLPSPTIPSIRLSILSWASWCRAFFGFLPLPNQQSPSGFFAAELARDCSSRALFVLQLPTSPPLPPRAVGWAPKEEARRRQVEFSCSPPPDKPLPSRPSPRTTTSSSLPSETTRSSTLPALILWPRRNPAIPLNSSFS